MSHPAHRPSVRRLSVRRLWPLLLSTASAVAAAAEPVLAPCMAAPPRLAVVDVPEPLRQGAAGAPPVCRAVVGEESRVVCRAGVAGEGADEPPRYRLSYWVNGRRVAEWPATPDDDGGAPAFTLELAELDGSSTPTLLLASADELRLLGHDAHVIGPVPALGWGDRSRALRVAGAARCVLRLDRGGDPEQAVHWYRLASSRLVEIPPPR